MQFYSYTTDTPYIEGMADEPVGTLDRRIDCDLRTIRGVVNRLKKVWPGRSFKVFAFSNFYDDRTFRQVFTHVVRGSDGKAQDRWWG